MLLTIFTKRFVASVLSVWVGTVALLSASLVTAEARPPAQQINQAHSGGDAIAIFTDPTVRSMLITVYEDANQLSLLKQVGNWSVVTAPKGLPVWVHSDFIQIENSKGVITANAVNARSVPRVSAGNQVGRLNKNEMVDILDQHKDWFRVQSPKRFQGWVTTGDLSSATRVNQSVTDVSDNQVADLGAQANAQVLTLE